MNDFHPYPWHQGLWSGLIGRLQRGRLPHALLLCGGAGMGKRDFAERFAHAVLCDTPREDGSACGQCRGCTLMLAGSHPDYLRVEPEEEGKAIGIDAVRALTRFQALKSQYGRQRVVQLQPAEALNDNASNALLKTLEEPAGETILLLSTDRPMSLMATIRSRCQQVIFRPPAGESHAAALAWLARQPELGSTDPEILLRVAGGAPLKALAFGRGDELAQQAERFAQFQALEQGGEDPVALAEQWFKRGPDTILPWLYLLLSDMVKLKMAPQAAHLNHPQLQEQLHALCEKVDLYFLQQLAEKVQRRLGLLRSPANPNQQAILEDLLLAWVQRRV
ncbi:MAG: DNA polymerase III subunit delta' [Pseudomonadota bacterium]